MGEKEEEEEEEKKKEKKKPTVRSAPDGSDNQLGSMRGLTLHIPQLDPLWYDD